MVLGRLVRWIFGAVFAGALLPGIGLAAVPLRAPSIFDAVPQIGPVLVSEFFGGLTTGAVPEQAGELGRSPLRGLGFSFGAAPVLPAASVRAFGPRTMAFPLVSVAALEGSSAPSMLRITVPTFHYGGTLAQGRQALSPFDTRLGVVVPTRAVIALAPLPDRHNVAESMLLPRTAMKFQPPGALRIGALRLVGRVSAGDPQPAFAPSGMRRCALGVNCVPLAGSGLRERRIATTASFAVHAGSRDLHVHVSSSLADYTRGASALFPYVPIVGLPFSMGSAEVAKHNVGARVAVPLTPGITLGVGYDQQRLHGVNSSATTLNARNDAYLGHLTFSIPRTSAALTLSAGSYRYQDMLSPQLDFSSTHEDLKLTVKF